MSVLFSLIGLSFAGSPATPYTGSWTDGTLQLELQAAAQGYTGSATLGAQTYQVQAIDTGAGLQGVAIAGFEQALFGATLQQGALVVQLADGTAYFLRNQQAAAVEASTALAQGAHGLLTPDDVAAFHEALLFCLDYAGVQDAKASLPPEKVRTALIEGFPKLTPEEQQGVANADLIWPAVKSGWSQLPASEQQAFVRDVLELAFGKQASRFGGSAGQGASSVGGSLPSIDMNVPGSDCWASAGCADFDPSTGSYSYESYDYSTGTYETY